MKRFIMTLFLLVGVLNLGVAQTKVFTFVCEDKEDFPGVMGNSPAILPNNPGAGIEALRLVASRLGIEIKFVRMPWTRALEFELKNGTVDGLFTASYKKERETFGLYPMKAGVIDDSKALYSSNYVFYKLKSSKIEWDGKTLTGLLGNIGAPRGYSIVGDLQKLGYTMEESDGTLTDFKKMDANRMEIAAELELTGDLFLERNPYLAQKIIKLSPPIVMKPYYVMLSKQFVAANPELAVKIWDSIGDMRSEYIKIAAKYLE